MKQGTHLFLVIQAIIATYSLSHVITPWTASRPGDETSNDHSSDYKLDTITTHRNSAPSPSFDTSIEPVATEKTLYRLPRPKDKQGYHQGHEGTVDGRSKRSTSKITGLVVGASANGVLKAKVKEKLNEIEANLWNLQSQITKPFGAQDQLPGMILGTFPSSVRTNFHGSQAASGLRQSQGVTDTNSLSTLLVLHCLTETEVYGGSKVKAASNMSIAVQALDSYHSRTYGRGSSILTLWQEKVMAGAQSWVNFPENIVKTKVKDNTTYSQLQALSKSCDCEPMKLGFKEISANKLCKEYFNVPFSDVIYDVATPPDFMTSFLNLALGGLLASDTSANVGVFKTDLKLWKTINNDVTRLVAKLKDLVIIYPTVRPKNVSRSTSATTDNNNLMKQSNSAEITHVSNISNGAPPASNVGHGVPSASNISHVVSPASNISPVILTEPKHKESINSSSLNGRNGNKLEVDLRTEECTSCNKLLQIVGKRREDNHWDVTSGNYRDITSADLSVTSPNIGQSSIVGDQIKNPVVSTATPSESPNSTPKPSESPTSNGTPSESTTSTTIPSLSPTPTPPTTINENTMTKPPKLTPSVNTTIVSRLEEIVALDSTINIKPDMANTSASSVSPLIAGTPSPMNITAPLSTPHADNGTGSASTPTKEPIIDSVSYFGLRHYLDDAVDKDMDVVLIPFWISDDAQAGRDVLNPGEVYHNSQVFHQYNSIDLTTTATVLHALIMAATTGMVDITNDGQLQMIVTSSLRLLTWYMTHPAHLATFVTLSSFPSKSMVYWSASRVAFQLSSDRSIGVFNFTENTVSSFLNSLRKDMTYDILQSIVDGGLGSDGVTRVYIDDFIGVADFDGKGAKKVSGDDRLFTSAMGVNSLLATWTVQGKDGSLKFIEGSDDSVKIAVNGLVNYVITALRDSSTLHENAYMSERVKNCKSLPAWFPSNIITTSDGKSINVKSPANTLRFGIKGHIPKDVYEKELAKPLFGHKVEVNPDTLNSPASIFRFWTSHGLTRSACLLAIAQAANLNVDNTE